MPPSPRALALDKLARPNGTFVRPTIALLVAAIAIAPASPVLAQGSSDHVNRVPVSGEGPIWTSAVRELQTQNLRAAQGGSGGSGSSSAAAWGWFGMGLVVSGLAFGLYGESDRCAFNNPYTTVCRAYEGVGVGFMIGGFIMVIAAAVHDTSKGGRGQSSAPRQSPPPLQPVPIEPLFDPGVRSAIDEIRGGNHSTMPPPQVAGRNAGGATTWSFRNDTTYTLFVYLAGPTTLSLTIPPGGARNATLQAGRYEIGARASANNVLPFYGVRDYASGYAYTDCFYIDSGCSR